MALERRIQDQWILKNLEFDQKSVSYITKGRGNPMVLLHGYLASSQIWTDIGSKLATSYKIIAINLPGHGNSDTWPPVHTMELMTEIVFRVLRNENIQKACIIGHSLGGYVALAFADIYPQCTESLILINSDPFTDTPERIKKRNREIALIKAGKKELLLSLTNTIPSNQPNQYEIQNKSMESMFFQSAISDDAMIATIEGMKQRPERIQVLKNSGIRSLFILGKKDPQLNYDKLIQSIKISDNVNCIILENSGHMTLTEKPELVIQEIMTFAWINESLNRG